MGTELELRSASVNTSKFPACLLLAVNPMRKLSIWIFTTPELTKLPAALGIATGATTTMLLELMTKVAVVRDGSAVQELMPTDAVGCGSVLLKKSVGNSMVIFPPTFMLV